MGWEVKIVKTTGGAVDYRFQEADAVSSYKLWGKRNSYVFDNQKNKILTQVPI